MIRENSDNELLKNGLEDIEGMDRTVSDAVREALRRHMLLGESVAVADDSGGGGVKMLGPDDIRKALKAA